MASIIETLLFKIGVEDATAEGFKRVESKMESFKGSLGGLGERTEKLRMALHMAGVSQDSFVTKAVHMAGIAGSMIGKFGPLEVAIGAVTAAVALGAKAWEMWHEQANQAHAAAENEKKSLHEMVAAFGKLADAQEKEARYWGLGKKRAEQEATDKRAELFEYRQLLAQERIANNRSGDQDLNNRIASYDREIASLDKVVQRLRLSRAIIEGRELGAGAGKEAWADIQADRRRNADALKAKQEHDKAVEAWSDKVNQRMRDKQIANAQFDANTKNIMEARTKRNAEIEEKAVSGLTEIMSDNAKRRATVEANEMKRQEEAAEKTIATSEMVGQAAVGLVDALMSGDEAALKSFVTAQAKMALAEAIVASAKAVGYTLIPGKQAAAIGEATLAAELFAAAAALGVLGGVMSGGGGGGGGSASAPASPQSFSPASGEGGPTNIYYINGHQINTSTGYDKVFADGSKRYEQSQKPKSKRSRF